MLAWCLLWIPGIVFHNGYIGLSSGWINKLPDCSGIQRGIGRFSSVQSLPDQTEYTGLNYVPPHWFEYINHRSLNTHIKKEASTSPQQIRLTHRSPANTSAILKHWIWFNQLPATHLRNHCQFTDNKIVLVETVTYSSILVSFWGNNSLIFRNMKWWITWNSQSSSYLWFIRLSSYFKFIDWETARPITGFLTDPRPLTDTKGKNQIAK